MYRCWIARLQIYLRLSPLVAFNYGAGIYPYLLGSARASVHGTRYEDLLFILCAKTPEVTWSTLVVKCRFGGLGLAEALVILEAIGGFIILIW